MVFTYIKSRPSASGVIRNIATTTVVRYHCYNYFLLTPVPVVVSVLIFSINIFNYLLDRANKLNIQNVWNISEYGVFVYV